MLPSTRTVFLHYHLFKNAGTSLDAILKQHFQDRWLTQEFQTANGNNTADIEAWIRATPHGIVYSTHTAIGPLPQIEGVEIVPLILLRDPVKRVISAYKFERQQQVDNWGANLAKSTDLEGYVTTRLGRPNDRQCRNFQASRLAPFCPGETPEGDRAIAGLDLIHAQGLVGLVSNFGDFIERLNKRVQQIDPTFNGEIVRSNVSSKSEDAPSPSVIDLLKQSNIDDARVLQHAENLLHSK